MTAPRRRACATTIGEALDVPVLTADRVVDRDRSPAGDRARAGGARGDRRVRAAWRSASLRPFPRPSRRSRAGRARRRRAASSSCRRALPSIPDAMGRRRRAATGPASVWRSSTAKASSSSAAAASGAKRQSPAFLADAAGRHRCRARRRYDAALRELYEETNVRSVSLLGEAPTGSPTTSRRRSPASPGRAAIVGQTAEMVRLPLHRRGQRDRRRAAGRRAAQAGVRRLALGAAGARPRADRPLQARRLRAGGGSVFALRRAGEAGEPRTALSRRRSSPPARRRDASLGAEAVQQPEQLQLALGPLHPRREVADGLALAHRDDVDAERLEPRQLLRASCGGTRRASRCSA